MLGWSLRLGSLFGIPIYLHWTFLLLIVWLVTAPLFSGAPEAASVGLRTAGFVLAIFGCVVLHELGHALAARRFGIATRDITLLPIGGLARLEKMPEKPMQELIVALAGPAVNVVIAAVAIPAVLVLDGPNAFLGGAVEGEATDTVALYQTNFLAALAMVNIFLVVFNMIPALPMDGGRVLRAVLAMTTDRGRATTIAAAVGQVVAVGFVLLGLFTGHILLMLIGVFVFLGAGAEAQSERFRSALEGLRARDAMITRFRSLRVSSTLRQAVDELLAGSQQDFPVLRDDARGDDDAAALVGVLARADLLRAMAQERVSDPISSIMRSPCAPALETEDLQLALERARRRPGQGGQGDAAGESVDGCPLIAVLRREGPQGVRIVGLITPDNITELVMVRTALRGRSA